jgi:hypothetical protein
MGERKMAGPSKEKLEAIVLERLSRWGVRMGEENSTPVLLLGVGHGDRSGQLTVCITEDLPPKYLETLVAYLYREVVERGKRF